MPPFAPPASVQADQGMSPKLMVTIAGIFGASYIHWLLLSSRSILTRLRFFPPIAFIHLHQPSSSSSLSASASYLTRSAALPAPRPPIARSPSPSPASTPSRTAVLPHVLASRCPSHPAPCVSHARTCIAWWTKPHGSRRSLSAPQRLPRPTTLGALRQ